MKKQKCYKKRRNVTQKLDIQQKYQDIRTLKNQLQNYADENLEIQEKCYYTCPKCGNDTLHLDSELEWYCSHCQRGGDIVCLASKVEGIPIPESLAFLSNRYSFLMKGTVKLIEYVLYPVCISSDEPVSETLTQFEAISFLKRYSGVSDFELRCLIEHWKNTDREALAGLEIAYSLKDNNYISENDFIGIELKDYQDASVICQYYHQEAISLCQKLVGDKTVLVNKSEVENLDYLFSMGFLGRFLKEAKSNSDLRIYRWCY